VRRGKKLCTCIVSRGGIVVNDELEISEWRGSRLTLSLPMFESTFETWTSLVRTAAGKKQPTVSTTIVAAV